jgi:hypothetical protein
VHNLERRRLFFDFVIDYTSSDSLEADSIQVDESMLGSFKEFVRLANEKDEYSLGSNHLISLREMVDEMGWKEAGPLLGDLEQAFERESSEGFTEGLESEIRLGLERELVLRVKGKKAQQLLDLQNDTQLEKAVIVLSDVSKYKETLAGRD